MPEKFTTVKRGYDSFEVDRYIESLEEIVKSYKEKDTAIKNAILNAQIAADNIIKNAELQANAIEKDAIVRLDNITSSITVQRQKLKSFEDEYNAFMQKYLKDINKNGIAELHESLDRLDEYVTKLKGVTEEE